MSAEHSFRIGDMVVVNSRTYECMNGSVGMIAVIERCGKAQDYGLDFSCGTFVCKDVHVNLHDLGGRLNSETGWWVGKNDIEHFCPDDDQEYSLEDLESIFA